MSRKTLSQTNWHDYCESRLSAYIDGELPDDERNQVRRHLNECTQCQTSLDSLGWTIKLVKQLPAPPLPRQFTLPVPATPARAPAGAGWLRWGLAAASGLAVLAVAFFITLELLRPTSGNVPSAAYAPQAAPAQPTVAAAAKSAPTTAPAANDSTAAGSTERQAIPTVTPQPAIVVPAAPPVAATVAPAPTQVPVVKPAATQPTATPQPPRATSRALVPTATPTMICEFGCGGGPDTAPPGMGGGGAEPTQTVGPSIMSVPQGEPPPLPIVVASGSVGADQLNVRAQPSEDAERVGLLYRNAKVDIVGRDDSARWIAILYHQPNQADQEAWVIANSIYLPVPVYDLPIIMMPPTTTPTPTPAGMAQRPPKPTATATATAVALTPAAPTSEPKTEPTTAVVQVTPTDGPPVVGATQAAPTAVSTLAAPATGPTATPAPISSN